MPTQHCRQSATLMREFYRSFPQRPSCWHKRTATAASSAAIAAALQRRACQKINQKPTSVPMTSMTTVLEEPVPPSDPGSYRSADEPDSIEEQSELPPADE
eukprot:2529253-Amphidinium_carterae.1